MIKDNLIERLFHCLIAGDSNGARNVIEKAIADGVSADTLIAEAYRPIALMIESLSKARQLTEPARSHATVLLQNLLDDVRAGQIASPMTRASHGQCEIETVLASFSDTPTDRYRTLSTNHYQDLPHRGEGPARNQFVSLSFANGILRARLVGPGIGQRESNIIGDEIDRALDLVCHGLRAFVMDLTDVQSMSSLGLNMCIELRNRAQSLGARSILCGVSRELADLFAMMNVDQLYDEATTASELAA